MWALYRARDVRLDRVEPSNRLRIRVSGLGFAMAVAFLLRVFRLGHQSLWVDEIMSWRAASPFGVFDWNDFFINTHGPLVSALSHAVLRLIGQSEWALRLPFAIATVLLVPATARLATRIAGPRAFLWAAWIVALSPLATWYGQEMRNYAFAFLSAALACETALAYRASGRLVDLALLALWCTLGALSNLNTAFLLPVLFGALLLSPPPNRRRVRPLVLALFAIALALSPWIINYIHVLALERLAPGRAALPDEIPLRGTTTFTWAAIPYTFYIESVGYSLGPSLRALHAGEPIHALRPHLFPIAATALIFGGVALTGLWSLRRRPFVLIFCLAVVLVPIAFVGYFALMNFKPYNPRYVTSGLPVWWALLAAGFVALPGRIRFVAAAAALLLCIASLQNHYFDPSYGKEDFRAAATLIARKSTPNDLIIATGGYSPIDYYLPGRAQIYWLGFAKGERMAIKFNTLLNQTKGATWVVVSRPEDLDPDGRFERWLQVAHRPQTTTFSGIRVYRITAPDSLH